LSKGPRFPAPPPPPPPARGGARTRSLAESARRGTTLADSQTPYVLREAVEAANQKWAVVKDFSVRRAAGGMTNKEAAQLGARIGVTDRHVRRLVEKADASQSMLRMGGSGRPPDPLRDQALDILTEFAESRGYIFSTTDAANHLGVQLGRYNTRMAVIRLMEWGGWKSGVVPVIPTLTDEHKKERLEYARAYVDYVQEKELVAVVLDEKTFMMNEPNEIYHCPPGVPHPWRREPFKSNPANVMFVCAIGWPVYDENGDVLWDGKFLFEAVGDVVEQSRRSKHMEPGDEKFKKSNVTKETTLAICRKVADKLAALGDLLGANGAEVQLDRAGAHGLSGKEDTRKVCDFCSLVLAIDCLFSFVCVLTASQEVIDSMCVYGHSLFTPSGREFTVTFVASPAKSPDLSLLDLGAWYSLITAKERVKAQDWGRTNMELKIVKACEAAWQAWDAAPTITNLVAKWKEVLQEIIKHNGGNDFRIPHVKKTK
jgi:hypothetical protein